MSVIESAKVDIRTKLMILSVHKLLKNKSFCISVHKLDCLREFVLYSYCKEVYLMIDTHELKKRDLYLNKIIAFQDTEPVKVVTGIRRCGKSSLLKLMVVHLKENGITDEQIIEMNFES